MTVTEWEGKRGDEVIETREGRFFKDLVSHCKYLAICDEWNGETLKVFHRGMIGSELSFNRITLKCVTRMWGRGGAQTEVRRTIWRLYNTGERDGGNSHQRGSSGRGETLWFWVKFKIEATVFPTKLSVEWEGMRGIKDDLKGFWFDEREEWSCHIEMGKSSCGAVLRERIRISVEHKA